jgi:hypothetical protein
MNRLHVVPTASGNYSEFVDNLVVSSPATLFAHERSHRYPPTAAFVHLPTGRVDPLPVGFLCNRLDMRAALPAGAQPLHQSLRRRRQWFTR